MPEFIGALWVIGCCGMAYCCEYCGIEAAVEVIMPGGGAELERCCGRPADGLLPGAAAG